MAACFVVVVPGFATVVATLAVATTMAASLVEVCSLVVA
jgi:hypothetical protein